MKLIYSSSENSLSFLFSFLNNEQLRKMKKTILLICILNEKKKSFFQEDCANFFKVKSGQVKAAVITMLLQFFSKTTLLK